MNESEQISNRILNNLNKITDEIFQINFLIKNIDDAENKEEYLNNEIFDIISQIQKSINKNSHDTSKENLERIFKLLRDKEIYSLAVLESLLKLLNELLMAENLPLIIATSVRETVYRDGMSGINCYPGIPNSPCFERAIFMSLNSKKYKPNSKVKPLSFNDALMKIVQHMQGYCFEETKKAIFITDSWNEDIFNQWKSNLRVIRIDKQIDCFLITGNKLSPINF